MAFSGGEATWPLLLLLAAAAPHLLAAAVYEVGDSAGWAVGPNYTDWASSKTFHVGDTILFEYDRGEEHNVLQVSKSAYKACKTGDPKAVYSSGNDSVVMRKKGRHHFICGTPGHCQAGQKVTILVVSKSKRSAVSPSPPPSPPSNYQPPSPQPFVTDVSSAAATGGLASSISLVIAWVAGSMFGGVSFLFGL